MARARNKLTARAVAALAEPGKHSDGGGLYLRINGDGANRRRWIFWFAWRGRTKEMGLGGCPETSLADARKARDLAEQSIRAGEDPIEAREASRRVDAGELYGARWPEIDFAKALWTIPAGRMKAAREHRVPLSSRALAILEKFSEAKTGEFVFAGQRAGKPLSGMAMEMMLRRTKVEGVTVHGFRSAFRDWAGNETQFARELAESALAHVIGDKAEQAYRRGDALEKRRALMEAWANYCEPEAGSNVVKLARPRS
jgi:hypothetical protein